MELVEADQQVPKSGWQPAPQYSSPEPQYPYWPQQSDPRQTKSVSPPQMPSGDVGKLEDDGAGEDWAPELEGELPCPEVTVFPPVGLVTTLAPEEPEDWPPCPPVVGS